MRSNVETAANPRTKIGKYRSLIAFLLIMLSSCAVLAQTAPEQAAPFSREPIHTGSWPSGKKVAVSFAFFVEEFGFGKGPILRPDLASRKPDLTNEAFRQYGIDWGIMRVGRLFKELDVPLTIVLNAEFPASHPSIWKDFRSLLPHAPIVAHGMNNTNRTLPLEQGLSAQQAYIRKTLDLIAQATGSRPAGWSSPSIYSNGDTMRAIAAEGISYTIDQMDSDIITRLNTPSKKLILLPYPTVTIDMSQYLARLNSPRELEEMWLDYVLELAHEARAYPEGGATTVVIGIHPFIVGTPDGAAALRRALLKMKADKSVWLTDTDAIMKALNLE